MSFAKADIRAGIEAGQNALLSEISQQKDRIILWMPVFIGMGIGLYFSLRFEPPAILVYGFCAFLSALWGLVWPLRAQGSGKAALWLMAGALFFSALGFAGAKARSDYVAAPLLEREIRIAELTGTVASVELLEKGQGVRLVLRALDIERRAPDKTPYAVRISVRGDAAEVAAGLGAGDKIRVLAGLNPPSAPVAPGAFDFQRYAWFERLGGFGFAFRAPELTRHQKPDGFNAHIARLRQVITARIHSALPPESAAVAAALMAGERAGISEADREAMRDSGLAHMLAISGLHVGLVAGIVFMAVRFVMAAFPALALRRPIKKYAALAALSAAFFYMLLVGAPVSTVRAMIMTGVVLLAVMLDRVAISLRLVALAAAVILVMTPEAMMGASFQMSFAAVTALVFFYDRTRHYWTDFYRRAGAFRRFLLYFVGVSATTIIATLATAPFSLFHFQQLALYSLLANFIAVPVLTFIVMPAAVLALFVLPLGLAYWPLQLAGAGIGWILAIAHGVADMPLSTWRPAAWPLSAFILMVGAALFYMLWDGRLRLLAGPVFLISIIMIYQFKQPDILVSSSGKLVALRHENGTLSVSSRVHDRFTADIWARQSGMGNAEGPLPRWVDSEDSKCDEYGCHTLFKGYRLAMATHESAHREDCARADILISSAPLRQPECRAAVTIGFFDLYNEGAHALWLPEAGQDSRIRIKTVQDSRGQRPWTVSHRR